MLMLPPAEAPASHKSLACSLLILLLSDKILFHIFCWAVAACMLLHDMVPGSNRLEATSGVAS